MTRSNPTPSREEIEQNLKQLIVEGLVLEDVEPGDIQPEEPLFVDGLGLDSVDALELAMIVQKEYGIKIRGTSEENEKHFRSLRSLATFVRNNLSEET